MFIRSLSLNGFQELTVADYLRRWLRDYAAQSVAASTLERYTGIVEHHLIPALGNLRLWGSAAGPHTGGLRAWSGPWWAGGWCCRRALAPDGAPPSPPPP